MTRVHIRGIYATALTEFLRESVTVVGASEPIERRFDEEFPAAEPDAAVSTTDDRQGVGVVGDPEAVGTVRERLRSVGLDALSWADPAPRGAVFEATVTETLGSGAVVDLGEREGFLPYGATEDYLDEGDERRVQVHEPAPPWLDRRPLVDTEIRAFGGLVDLVRGAEGTRAALDGERATELVRTTAMLPTAVPEGWGVRWNRAAADADMDALDGALGTATQRAAAVESALDGGEHPEATAWVWFGRESRFALDERREAVATTMPGHHRIKAADEAASAAVDFVERLCEPDGEFPFEAVVAQFGPAVGDTVRIEHGKPAGRRFALGAGEVTDRDGREITVRREMTGGGEYDALGVPREAGDVAITRLKEGRWWYPTVYRDADGGVKGTYVNVCTPVELFPEAATYVDLHVDVVRHPDGTVERVDDDELDEAVAAGQVPEDLAAKAREVATAVERALS